MPDKLIVLAVFAAGVAVGLLWMPFLRLCDDLDEAEFRHSTQSPHASYWQRFRAIRSSRKNKL